MKRARHYEIEAVDPAKTSPWRFVIEIWPDRTYFHMYWGDKPTPTHSFVVTSTDWKEISHE